MVVSAGGDLVSRGCVAEKSLSTTPYSWLLLSLTCRGRLEAVRAATTCRPYLTRPSAAADPPTCSGSCQRVDVVVDKWPRRDQLSYQVVVGALSFRCTRPISEHIVNVFLLTRVVQRRAHAWRVEPINDVAARVTPSH